MSVERVPLYSGPDHAFAARLMEALRAGGLDPSLEPAEAGTQVMLAPDQIARGAMVLAALAPGSTRDAAARWRRIWVPLLFIPVSLVSMAGGIWGAAETPMAGIATLVLPLCAWYATRKLDAPNANRFGTYGLIWFAVGSGLGWSLKVIEKFDLPAGVRQTVSFLEGACIVIALVLAVIGLVRGYKHPQQYSEGRGHGWWVVALGSLAAVGFVIALAAPTKGPPPGQATMVQPVQGTPMMFNDLNFKLRMPPPPWVRSDVKKLNKDATVGFNRFDQDIGFILIAEKAGVDFDSEGLLELWRGRLVGQDPNLEFDPPRPVELNGLPALEGAARLKLGKLEISYYNWAVARNGFVYQLLAYGKRANQAAIHEQGWALASTFELIDPKAFAIPPVEAGPPSRPFRSADFGYSVDLSGTPWTDIPKVEETFPSAEFAAMCGDGPTLTVMPYALLGNSLPADVLTGALAARFEVEPNGPGVTRKPFKAGAFSGEELESIHDRGGVKVHYRLRAVSDGNVAMLVSDTRANDPAGEQPGCGNAIEKVLLGKSGPIKPGGTRSRQNALFLLSAGSQYELQGKLEAALKLHRQALELDPKSTDAAWAMVDVSRKLGKSGQAKKLLDQLLKGAPPNAPLYAVRAGLLAGDGKPGQAIEDYERLFKAGFEDDAVFARYLHLLERQGQTPHAFKELAKYQQHRDTAQIAMLEAKMLQTNEQLPRAIEVLKTRMKASSTDLEIAQGLSDLYQSAEMHPEAIALGERLVAQGKGTVDVLMEKAESEIALKWMPTAKATLELALKKDPGNAEAHRMLDHVSSALGEGANSSIKDPIEPVALPASLMPAGGAAPAGDLRAFYQWRAKAISFVKDKELRTTEYFRVQILNQAGVELFSTLDFEFDPKVEGIFVNTLKVLDARGATVSVAKASDAYLSDQASQQLGTSKRTLYLPVPGLKPGSVIDLAITRKANTPPSAMWFTREFLSATIPVSQAVVFVRGDLAALRHRATADLAPAPIEGGLAWVSRLPVPYKPEPFEVPVEDYSPTVWLGDGAATWEAELGEYLTAIADVTRPDAAVEKLGRRLIEGASTREAKIALLSRYVQSEVLYKAIEFGRGARVPRVPSDVVEHRYGDCKDHALLLQQLLASAGVESRLALIRSWGPLVREVPSLDQFDHMVVFIPGDVPRFIDATLKWTSLVNEPGSWLAGREALLVQAGPARFVSVPANTVGLAPEVELERTIKRAGADFDVQESLTLRGQSSLAIRELLTSVESDRRPAQLQTWLGRDFRVQSMKVEDLGELEKPLKLKLHYVVDGQLHEVGDEVVGKLAMGWERNRVPVPSVDARISPFEIRAPFAFRSVTTFAIPPGHQLVPLRSAQSSPAAAPYGSWTVAVEPSASTATVRFAYQRKGGRFPAVEYGAFREDLNLALAAIEQPLVLKKTAPRR